MKYHHGINRSVKIRGQDTTSKYIGHKLHLNETNYMRGNNDRDLVRSLMMHVFDTHE